MEQRFAASPDLGGARPSAARAGMAQMAKIVLLGGAALVAVGYLRADWQGAGKAALEGQVVASGEAPETGGAFSLLRGKWASSAEVLGVDDVNTENGAAVQIDVQEAALDRAQEEEEDDEREIRELELAKRHDLWVEPKRLNVDEVCKRMFGNGYTNLVQICNSEEASMDCWYSPTSRGAICEGSNLVLDPALIDVAPGGEDPAAVIGRKDADEIPAYKNGAFKQNCQLPETAWDPEMLAAHLKLAMGAVASDPKGAAASRCSSFEETPTLFVTRYEYADVYSTVADWYNAYQAQQQLADGERVNVVFLDGHPQGPLDEAWTAMFGASSVRYVKSLASPTCFRKAIFVPVGARGALSVTNFEELASCKRVPQVRNFANSFVSKMIGKSEDRAQLADAKIKPKPVVLVFLRNPFKPAQVLSDEDELRDSLRGLYHADIRFEPFKDLSFRERVALVRGAQVIVGMHDAALSFVLFARPGTTLIELQLPEYQGLSYYSRLTQFVGAAHRVVSLPPTEDGATLHRLPASKLHGAIADAVPGPKDTGI